MRRLYSTFAGGWPGTGLLLMRSVIGCVLVVRASLRLWGDPPLNITIPAAILLVAGFLLMLGLWTPIVGASVAVIEVWKILTQPGDKWLWLLLGTAVSLSRCWDQVDGRSMLAFSGGSASKPRPATSVV